MSDISIDEVLKRLNMTPAELAGQLAYTMKQHGFDKLNAYDEPLQIQLVHDELKARIKPSRSL